MAVPPVIHARMLLAAAAIAAHRIALRLRRHVQPVGPVPGVGAAKLVQYDVLLPPDNAADVAKLVQFDVLVPPDNAVDIGKLVQYVALVPPDNAVAAAKSVQYTVLEAPPPIPRPLLWNSALVLSDLSGDIAPAPVLRRQNRAVPSAPVTWLPRPPLLATIVAALHEAEHPLCALWPLWRRAASADTWARSPLPAPSVALLRVGIANNLPTGDPPSLVWTRRFLAADTYNQRQSPIRLLLWRLGTALTFPEPRVDLRKFVQKGRPPFNEYDPVIIVN